MLSSSNNRPGAAKGHDSMIKLLDCKVPVILHREQCVLIHITRKKKTKQKIATQMCVSKHIFPLWHIYILVREMLNKLTFSVSHHLKGPKYLLLFFYLRGPFFFFFFSFQFSDRLYCPPMLGVPDVSSFLLFFFFSSPSQFFINFSLIFFILLMKLISMKIKEGKIHEN